MSSKSASGSTDPERSFAGVQKKISAKLSDCRGLASLARDAADPAHGKSPKELITAQSRLRSECMVTSDLVAAAEKLYNTERDKKRSRYSEQDLEDFRASTGDYKGQVQDLIQASRTSYLQKNGGGGQDIEMGHTALGGVKDSGLLQGKAGGGFFKARAPTEEMNAEHREGLAELKARDKGFDSRFEKIGAGIGELGEIAKEQQEEVKRGTAILNDIELNLTKAHDGVEKVNKGMRQSLIDARKSKLGCDIMCLIVMVGLIVGLILITKEKKQ